MNEASKKYAALRREAAAKISKLQTALEIHAKNQAVKALDVAK